jgi:hypothetical protein
VCSLECESRYLAQSGYDVVHPKSRKITQAKQVQKAAQGKTVKKAALLGIVRARSDWPEVKAPHAKRAKKVASSKADGKIDSKKCCAVRWFV